MLEVSKDEAEQINLHSGDAKLFPHTMEYASDRKYFMCSVNVRGKWRVFRERYNNGTYMLAAVRRVKDETFGGHMYHFCDGSTLYLKEV